MLLRCKNFSIEHVRMRAQMSSTQFAKSVGIWPHPQSANACASCLPSFLKLTRRRWSLQYHIEELPSANGNWHGARWNHVKPSTACYYVVVVYATRQRIVTCRGGQRTFRYDQWLCECTQPCYPTEASTRQRFDLCYRYHLDTSTVALYKNRQAEYFKGCPILYKHSCLASID